MGESESSREEGPVINHYPVRGRHFALGEQEFCSVSETKLFHSARCDSCLMFTESSRECEREDVDVRQDVARGEVRANIQSAISMTRIPVAN
jgi:hypothetical protein